MAGKKSMTNKKTLRAILEASRIADKIFNQFNRKDLSEIKNYQLASCFYGVGHGLGILEAHKEFAKNIPDYQQTITRFEIMRDKLYKEAQRRDGE